MINPKICEACRHVTKQTFKNIILLENGKEKLLVQDNLFCELVEDWYYDGHGDYRGEWQKSIGEYRYDAGVRSEFYHDNQFKIPKNCPYILEHVLG